MLTELLAAIKLATGLDAGIIAGQDLPRFVTVAPYAASSIYGEDANILDIPKVQIDIYVQEPDDTLPYDVAGVLQTFALPYTVEALMEYDESTNRLRTILQAEVI